MSDERRGPPGPEAGEPQVKVVDRRRFRSDGAPVENEEGGSEETLGAQAAEVPADPRAAQLAAQEARIDELTRAYAALVEDNKAFRQRLERERARLVEAERINVVQGLLEAADDLERALAAASAGEAQGDAFKSLAEGVRLSLVSLHKRISELGAQKIPVQGQPFDPHIAEAIDVIPVADAAQDGLVLHEIRAGYRIGDRVLRPARVRVGRLAQA
ncbi:nucleotide exchange factor GrpE [Anaeromyxobacter terrae]|uniref:nucleotide exchange factor GrpE n=1 Tax=Anaeromyxobacter terrae TaxID=2925406 RepID=UPI001F561345|nr:nucleotide exchange factor GrpE [Anaeromyxobacter sp. SG22]